MLTSTAEANLRRVFRIFNQSFSRVLSDEELSKFQVFLSIWQDDSDV